MPFHFAVKISSDFPSFSTFGQFSGTSMIDIQIQTLDPVEV